MYYVISTREPTTETDRSRLTPATDREHLGTVLCGLWMTVGLFLDGYFHQNLDSGSESFVTPWHAVFYAGFAASALWIASMSRRRAGNATGRRFRHLPPGYELAGGGLILFAAGGVGDATWHQAFGVERGVDALLSPTHLLLFVGLVLILSAPFRAGSTPAKPKPWMIAASLTSATALVGFFLNFVWGLGISAYARTVYDPVSEAGEIAVVAGVASMLVTTGVLFGAARLLAGHHPPRFALVVLFGTVALLVSGAFDEDIEGVVAAVVAGAVLEVLRRSRAGAPLAFAAAAGAMWLSYFALLGVDGIEWQPEIWAGAIVLNAIAAGAIAPAALEWLAPEVDARA